MSYNILSWCASCGKAKSYVAEYGSIPPPMCTCSNSVEIRPAVNTAPPTQFDVTYRYNDLFSTPVYHFARLIPDNMQELEQMIRRVVSEEVGRFFGDKREVKEEEEDESTDETGPFTKRG